MAFKSRNRKKRRSKVYIGRRISKVRGHRLDIEVSALKSLVVNKKVQSRKSENYTLVTGIECAKSEILSRNIVENKTPSCDDNIECQKPEV